MARTGGLARARKAQGEGPERMCALTRDRAPRSGLIRFVAGPDGTLVPDMRARLPGRGVHVTATRAAVDEAARRNVFARGLKRAVAVPDDLGALVDRLLAEAALGALSLARKAGAVTTGAQAVDEMVRSAKACGVLHAVDASSDGLRKVVQATRAVHHLEPAMRVPVWRIFDTDRLSVAVGGFNVVHVGLKDDGAGRNGLARVAELAAYRAIEPANPDVASPYPNGDRDDDRDPAPDPPRVDGTGETDEAGDGRTRDGRPASRREPRTHGRDTNGTDGAAHGRATVEGDEDAR